MGGVLLEDTRNPVEKHKNVHEWAEREGVTIIRTKLLVGDYTLPTDQRIIIDTKKDMQEVYGDIVQDHDRFHDELDLAMKAGVKLIVLVEEGDIEELSGVVHWKNPRRERWFKINAAQKAGKFKGVKLPKRPPVSSDQLFQQMQTMAERYQCEWRFCGKDRTGAVIWELLNQTGDYS